MNVFDLLETVKNFAVIKDQSLRAVLHMHIGMIIFLALAMLTRDRLRSPVPLMILLTLECLNEAADMAGFWSWTWSWRWRDTTQDFANTMIWPVVLFLLVRWWDSRDRETADADQESSAEPAAGD